MTAVERVDRDLPLTRVRTMEEVADQTLGAARFRAALVGAFAAVALVLAAVGIFGLLAFSVSQRIREFGIRMALGSRALDVLVLVLRRGLLITSAGITLGLLCAMLMTRFLSTLLYGVGSLDPVALSGAAFALAVVALTACIVPAMRAARINPAIALRME